MAIYRFTGRVLPPHYKIDLPILPAVHWRSDLGHPTDCVVRIVQSNIEVICDSNETTEDDYVQVHLRAVDSVRSLLQ
jgi:hypothetical protein